MTKFDAAERNDVLDSTRIGGGNGAALDLGAFGFKVDEPGPGVLVTSLPEKYPGPLKMGDRSGGAGWQTAGRSAPVCGVAGDQSRRKGR